MGERHHHITHTAPDGTIYETCGFWENEDRARAVVSCAYPDHTIDDIETDARCTV